MSQETSQIVVSGILPCFVASGKQTVLGAFRLERFAGRAADTASGTRVSIAAAAPAPSVRPLAFSSEKY